jgi:regulator of replication initiation timing
MSRSSEFLKAVKLEKLEAENAKLRVDNKVLRDALEDCERESIYSATSSAARIAREALDKTKEVE